MEPKAPNIVCLIVHFLPEISCLSIHLSLTRELTVQIIKRNVTTNKSRKNIPPIK